MFFLSDLLKRKSELPDASSALPGRQEPIESGHEHFVSGRAFKPPFDDNLDVAYFGMGCFWGVERLFWQLDGVWVTAVGYAGGHTINPTYQETCTGMTGHTEIVMVVFDPKEITYETLLRYFWENHDPTQGMRQGNDVGSVYRSAIYTSTDAHEAVAKESMKTYQASLDKAGMGRKITTEIKPVETFYYAEGYHQQYLAKNPGGYCNMKGTGVACSVTS